MSFVGNPISIKKEGRAIGVIPVRLPITDSEVETRIYNKLGQLVYEGIIDNTSMVSVDLKEEVITIVYLNRYTKAEIEQVVVDLYERFQISEERLQDREEKESEKLFYEKLYFQVKNAMDNPLGTVEEVEEHTQLLNKTTMDEKARNYVESKIRQVVMGHHDLTDTEVGVYTRKIYANLYGMGVLQEIDDDSDVGEIMVNGFIYPKFRCDIYYVKKGEKIKYDKTFESLEDLKHVFSRAIAFSKKELNNVENAMVEAMRSNRDRVNIIIPDASESYVMNIRKFGNFVPNMNSMKEYGTVDPYIDQLMEVLVKGKANIGIGGEMGTGKTTFINYLLTYTPLKERKVIISSVSETDVDRVLKGHDVVILNVDDEKGFSFERQVRASLRTTASRVIVPESRGSEFKQVYEANLKTKGNMFTAHALDDYSFLDMCVDMYIGDGEGNLGQVREKLAKSMEIIIIMKKAGKDIRIKSISEVELDEKRNFLGMNLLYEWVQDEEDATKGQYRRTKNRLSKGVKAKLNEFGVPMSMLESL